MNTSLDDLYKRATDYFINQIQQSKIVEDPFKYVEQQVLEPDFCNYINHVFSDESKLLPLNETGLTGKQYSGNRKVIIIKSPPSVKIDENMVSKDPEVQRLYRWFNTVVGPTIKNKFDVTEQTEDELLYMVDGSNYYITPHTDVPRKVISVLLYVPDDTSYANYGTNILRNNNNTFEVAHVTKFVPGSMLAFKRTEKSWHSVPPVPEHVKRKLFAYTINKAPQKGM